MIHWWVKGLISIKKFKQLWIYQFNERPRRKRRGTELTSLPKAI